jgi:uncharacterized membrane protein
MHHTYMKASYLVIIAVLLLSILTGIYFYNRMPVVMVSHWNTIGEPNGYMSRFWGLFLMPIIGIMCFVLFVALPMIDPLKHNVEKFREYFDLFIVIFFLFLFYIYLLTILWNLGYIINIKITTLLIPAFSILFYYAGILIENSQRNWFIGIRTPWTLSSDYVWNKTHALGGKLFKIGGVLMILGIFFQKWAMLYLLVIILVIALWPVVYSYHVFKTEKKH